MLTPNSGKGAQLRVPVHANPKPSSTLTATRVRRTARRSPSPARGWPTGRRSSRRRTRRWSAASSSWAPARSCRGARREPAPTCYKSELERSVDLAAAGVATDGVGRASTSGCRAHGRFTSPETAVNYGVYIDATGDGAWDYQVTTTRIADFDAPLVVVTDRRVRAAARPGTPYVGFLNVADGTVDTNAFDSDVQVLAAPLSVMPLITGRIGFGVQAVSAYGTVDDLGHGAPHRRASRCWRLTHDELRPARPRGCRCSGARRGLRRCWPPADRRDHARRSPGTRRPTRPTPRWAGTKGALVVLHAERQRDRGGRRRCPVGPGRR